MANNFLNLTDTQLEAYSTLAIAGLTLVYVLVGVFQWWAMRAALKVTQASNKNTARSIEIAEQGMELQHRAWLWVTKVETATISLEVETITMTIENLGAVPAANVNAYVNLEFVPGTEIPDSVPVEVGRKVLSEAVIGQNRHGETVIAWDSPAAAQWNEVNNGSTLLLIYCRLEYSDYFAKKQRTAIGCWQFDPSYREPTHAWIPAAKHNLL